MSFGIPSGKGLQRFKSSMHKNTIASYEDNYKIGHHDLVENDFETISGEASTKNEKKSNRQESKSNKRKFVLIRKGVVEKGVFIYQNK